MEHTGSLEMNIMIKPTIRNRSRKIHIKGIENNFNKIIEETFLNLENEMPIHMQESYRPANRTRKTIPCVM